MSPRILVAALLAVGLFGARPARAQATFCDSSCTYNVNNVAILGTAVLIAPPLVANLVSVIEQKHPPAVWPTLGLVLGAAGIALGMAYAVPNSAWLGDSEFGSDARTTVGLGVALIVEGAIDMALAIWAMTLPRKRTLAADGPPTAFRF